MPGLESILLSVGISNSDCGKYISTKDGLLRLDLDLGFVCRVDSGVRWIILSQITTELTDFN